jgi:ketosteroid isomerase-like protein
VAAPERRRPALSQTDADMIRRAFETWNDEGPEALVERFWAEDAVYRELPGWPDAAIFQGREAALERMRSVVDLVGPIEVRLEDLIEADDGRLVAIVRMVGESGPSQLYTESFAVVHRVRDGRVVEADYYLDPAQALDAAGITGR